MEGEAGEREPVLSSFANVALLYAVSREEARMASVGGWAFGVERLFAVRLGNSQDYQDSKLTCDGVK